MMIRNVNAWTLLMSLAALIGCQNQDVETRSRRSSPDEDASTPKAEAAEARPDEVATGGAVTTEGESETVTEEQEQIATFALRAAEMPAQADSDLVLTPDEANQEPTDEHLLKLIELAKARFPALANLDLQKVAAILKPADEMALKGGQVGQWTAQPRQSGTGPLGGKWQGGQITSTSGTTINTVSGKGAFGNFAGAGTVSNPNVGAGAYAFGWIPGVGFGVAYGGISKSGQGGGGYCGISVNGSGCGTF